MHSKTIRKIFTLALLILLPAFAACDRGNDNKDWRLFREALEREKGRSNVEISVPELAEVFSQKHELMMNVVLICESSPSIRRVGIADNALTLYGNQVSDMKIEAAADSIRSILAELPALSVECGRRGDIDGNPLAVVWFVMYASGISVAGNSRGIAYNTEWSQVNAPINSEQASARGYRALAKDGWYIYETQ